MGRSITRTNDLHKVFRNGDSELLNQIGALCILFEDFRHEVASFHQFLPEVTDSTPDVQILHQMLYYLRRSLVTLDEARERLQAICTNEQFRSARHHMKQANFLALVEARRYLNRNGILKSLRNSLGAHIDPEKVVRASIQYYGPNAISSIHWSDTQTDFALQLDFATHILEGAIASHLPGGAERLEQEMSRFFGVMTEAYKHLQNATFILIHAFLWDRFAAG